MKLGRTSIAMVMYLTTILAVDLAWLRVIHAGIQSRSVVGFEYAINEANGFLFDFGLLGMFNVLAFALLWLQSSRPERRSFFIGFQVSGVLAMFVYWAICCRWGAWLLPVPRFQHSWGVFRVGEVTNDALRAIGVDPKSVVRQFGSNIFVTIARIAVLTFPQLIFAYAGAILGSRVMTRGGWPGFVCHGLRIRNPCGRRPGTG